MRLSRVLRDQAGAPSDRQHIQKLFVLIGFVKFDVALPWVLPGAKRMWRRNGGLGQ
jgi:hypothetical protein